MDTKPVNELLDKLLSALESLEAKSEATLLFLKQNLTIESVNKLCCQILIRVKAI